MRDGASSSPSLSSDRQRQMANRNRRAGGSTHKSILVWDWLHIHWNKLLLLGQQLVLLLGLKLVPKLLLGLQLPDHRRGLNNLVSIITSVGNQPTVLVSQPGLLVEILFVLLISLVLLLLNTPSLHTLSMTLNCLHWIIQNFPLHKF